MANWRVQAVSLAGFATLASVLSLAGCSQTSAPAAPVASTLTFSQSPIPLDVIEFVVPPGNLNPPDHTLPTDHAYFYFRLFHPDAPQYEVVVPAGGTVRDVRRENDDYVRIEATSAHTYTLGHVKLDASIVRGMAVTAGQRLGVTSNLSYGIDLGLASSNVTLPFVAPGRYSDDTLHSESPFKYFAEPLRSALYAKERGAGGDGRIAFDQNGTLAGNWFLEGLTGIQSTLFASGPMQLAFVRDVDDPSSIRVSMGGTLGMTGAFAVMNNAPDPASITPASGPVVYQLTYGGSGSAAVQGVLLVELIDAQHLRVEAFPGNQSTSVAFTSAARIYAR